MVQLLVSDYIHYVYNLIKYSINLFDTGKYFFKKFSAVITYSILYIQKIYKY